MFEPALRHAVSRVVGSRRRRILGNYDSRHAKKSRRTHDRSEIVGVSNTIEHEHRLGTLRPSNRLSATRHLQRWRVNDSDDSAVMQRAGNFLQFGWLHLTVNFFLLGERF